MKLALKTKSANYVLFIERHNMKTNHINPITMSKTKHDDIHFHYPFHCHVLPRPLHMPIEPTIGVFDKRLVL